VAYYVSDNNFILKKQLILRERAVSKGMRVFNYSSMKAIGVRQREHKK
jgi:hypothetical protein